jgi:hypothetical protein
MKNCPRETDNKLLQGNEVAQQHGSSTIQPFKAPRAQLAAKHPMGFGVNQRTEREEQQASRS